MCVVFWQYNIGNQNYQFQEVTKLVQILNDFFQLPVCKKVHIFAYRMPLAWFYHRRETVMSVSVCFNRVTYVSIKPTKTGPGWFIGHVLLTKFAKSVELLV